jgi:hypothetical protein
MFETRTTDVFTEWVDNLKDIKARARIQVRIERLAAGNPGDSKPVGAGVSEWTTIPDIACTISEVARRSSSCLPVATNRARTEISKSPAASNRISRENVGKDKDIAIRRRRASADPKGIGGLPRSFV